MSNLKKFDFDGVNKFLVTGFHESDNFSMSSLLDKNGITFAKPSKNEKMDASEISEIILKTQKKSTSSQVLNISPVWNSLALDLFLGNIDQELWCWNDSKALELLEYWKNLDNEIAFILVYNSPEQIIADLLNNETLESLDEIDDVLEKWTNYNEKLLHFYYRNKEKSLLIHAGQIDENQAHYLEILHEKVGIEFKGFNFVEEIEHQFDTTKVLEKNKEQITSTQSFLISQIVSENYQAQKIYEELHSVANVFYNTKNLPNSKKALYDFLLLKQNYEEESNSLKTEKQFLVEESRLLLGQFHKVQEELEEHYINNSVLTQEIKQLKEQLFQKYEEIKKFEKVQDHVEEQEAKNTILLQQLHAIQEELERYYLTNSQLTQNFTKINDKLELQQKTFKEELAKKDEKLVVLQKEKVQAEEQVEENRVLLEQLHAVQEEVEKYYLENQRLEENQVKKKVYYGAADRIKDQLSYRLGAKMIEKSNSFFGILGLPMSLLAVRSEYKKDMANRKEKLPPIETYVDAYDAKRMQKHLSYMLGQTMIKTMKTPLGLFILPFKLSATYSEFKKNKR